MNAQPPRTSDEAVTAATGSPRPTARRTPARLERALAIGLGVGLPIVLGGCQVPTFWGYRGATTQAHDEFNLYVGTFIAALVVGAITGGLILWSVIAYRRKNEEMPRQFQYHIPLEITYTIVPIVIVLVLFVFTFVTENKVDALTARPYARVTVTGFQWGWKFDYTDQHVYVEGAQRQDPDPVGSNGVLDSCTTTATTPDYCLGPGLVLPVGEQVAITLVSADVIHGFYVPEFNFSRYAQPGVTNHFDFDVKHTGVYRAQCTQLCGLYHSQMFFHVVALTPSQWQAWVHGSQPTPDSSTTPNVNGIGANENLPPAYPPGSHAGSVVYPAPGQNSSSTTTTSTPSSTTTSSTTTTSTSTTNPSATTAP